MHMELCTCEIFHVTGPSLRASVMVSFLGVCVDTDYVHTETFETKKHLSLMAFACNVHVQTDIIDHFSALPYGLAITVV